MNPGVEHQNEISLTNQKFMDAFGRGDAAGIAALYTREGQLLPPNSETVTGKEGIQAFWQGAMNMGIAAVKLETVELEISQDAAIECGKFALEAMGGKPIDNGKFVVIWKKEEGQWKLHRDIWNSSKSG